jgi:hypothetical protein
MKMSEFTIQSNMDLFATYVGLTVSKYDLAKEKMEAMLTTHEPKPLTPKQGKATGEILEKARSFYKGRGLM